MKNLRLEDLPKATEVILEKLTRIEQELANLKIHYQPKEPVELLTREETAEYLKISLSTLWHWTKKGKINAYGIGNRVYYKRKEVENGLIRIN